MMSLVITRTRTGGSGSGGRPDGGSGTGTVHNQGDVNVTAMMMACFNGEGSTVPCKIGGKP